MNLLRYYTIQYKQTDEYCLAQLLLYQHSNTEFELKAAAASVVDNYFIL